MATDIASLDIFTEGVAQLLAPLTDDVDDKEATTTVQFALQAAGTDVVKLQSLIDAIYDKVTPRDKCSARLIVKLWKAVPDIIGTTVNTEKGNVVKKGARLVRHYVLQKCQSEFPLGMETEVWSTKSIAVVLAMWQADLEGLNTLIGRILHEMVESEHLFGHRNFETFTHACRTCGLMLEQDGEDDTLTRCINRAWTRTAAESNGHKLMLAGLVASRECDWETELKAEPRVLTPAGSDFEVEMQATVKTRASTDV